MLPGLRDSSGCCAFVSTCWDCCCCCCYCWCCCCCCCCFCCYCWCCKLHSVKLVLHFVHCQWHSLHFLLLVTFPTPSALSCLSPPNSVKVLPSNCGSGVAPKYVCLQWLSRCMCVCVCTTQLQLVMLHVHMHLYVYN